MIRTRAASLRPLFWLCVVAALSLHGCGGSEADDPTDVAADTAGQDDTTEDTTATDTPETDTVEPIDPYEAVPAERLPGDVSACPAGFDTGFGAGQHTGFEVAGQSRSFLLHLPQDGGEPLPLFVGFHGTDQTGGEVFTSWGAQAFVDAGFVVLMPDGQDNGGLWPTWDAMHQPGDDQSSNVDLAFFDALLECVAVHHAIDRHRVYVGGHSAGGIMTNHVLRSRSSMLAGGIVASGIFDLTAPDPAQPLDPMAVLVTWGGDNDAYSGTTDSGVTLPSFNFAEQAAIASKHYEEAPGVTQAHCAGDDLGHTWLDPINTTMTDFLLAHPKGLADNPTWTLPASPAPDISCSPEAATFVPPVVVECVEQNSPACLSYCQFIGDCAVENSTVGPVLAPQLEALGFSGDDLSECGGCITLCEEDETAGGSADAEVLGCFQTAFETEGTMCGSGVDGAMPFINATNACCENRTDSALCQRLCGTIKTNNIAIQLVTSCEIF